MDALDNDLELIQFYVRRKTDSATSTVVSALKECGFTIVDYLNGLINIQRGQFKGYFDIRHTLVEIASEDGKGLKFDRELQNLSYELLKTNTILQLKLKIVIAAFSAQNEKELDDKLIEMTKTSENLTIRVRSAVKD